MTDSVADALGVTYDGDTDSLAARVIDTLQTSQRSRLQNLMISAALSRYFALNSRYKCEYYRVVHFYC